MYPPSLLVPPPLFLPLSPVDSPVSTGSHSLVLTPLPLSSFPPTFHHLPFSPTQPSWLLSGPLHMWNQCFHVKISHGSLTPPDAYPRSGGPSLSSLCLLLLFFHLSSYLFHSMATNRVDKFSLQSLFLFPTPFCPLNNSPWHLPWLRSWCQRDKVKGTPGLEKREGGLGDLASLVEASWRPQLCCPPSANETQPGQKTSVSPIRM